MIKYILYLIGKLFPKEEKPFIEKSLGLSKSPEDKRDFQLRFSYDPDTIPLKYNIEKMPNIRNQGPISSCASFAAIGSYEIQLLNNDPRKYLEGSELFHYYAARKHINKTYPKDKGMTLRDACKTMDKYKMLMEYAYPYFPSKYNQKPTSLMYSLAKLYKISRYEALINLDEIKQSILENNPVMCGLPIKMSFYKVNYNNDIYVPTGSYKGGHALLIIGYNDVTKQFKLRNSWGQYYGRDGYFKMDYDVFIKHSFDWFRVIIK